MQLIASAARLIVSCMPTPVRKKSEQIAGQMHGLRRILQELIGAAPPMQIAMMARSSVDAA
jgi:hypothetical protein